MPIGSSVQVQHMSLTKHNQETHVDTKFITSSSNEEKWKTKQMMILIQQFLPIHFYSNPTDKNLT